MRTLATLVLLLLAGTVRADIRLPAVIADGMVLQRGGPVALWGRADEGEKVTVTFRGQRATALAKSGRWSVRLQPGAAGGPFPLSFEGKNRIEFKDVLVGEVWVCSGQSNMQWALRQSLAPEAAIASSANPNLRLFQVAFARADAPQDDLKATIPWSAASVQSVPNFSAVGYFFGRALQEKLGVPVGLIQTAVGGTPAESWTPLPALSAQPSLKTLIDSAPDAQRRFEAARRTWRLASIVAHYEGKTPPPAPRAPWLPSELYNAMVHPLIGYGVQGAIWYQGESNTGRATQYRTLFPTMIQSWRQALGRKNFPFLLVQLAPFQGSGSPKTEYAELREAQTYSTRVLKNVGMAVITDVGEEADIHPKKKQPVGERLALLARKLAYGEKALAAHSPSVRRVTFSGGQAHVTFQSVGGGLRGDADGTVQGFELAGPDGVFHPARARLNAAERAGGVDVVAAAVPMPRAVRFGFRNFMPVSLFSAEGLPAEPFRTDIPKMK